MDKIYFDLLNAAYEKRFDVFVEFETNKRSVVDAITTLEQTGLLKNGVLTEKGLHLLEPYRVKRAIYMAAGLGSRMLPITINTPKPLVKVNGKRFIETSLDAVLAAGIDEIYVVRGYLGEQFDLLLKQYPMIRFIENKDYNGGGTITSFYSVRNLLRNAYVLESDLIINNPAVIHKYHYTSDFLGNEVSQTDDWYLKVNDGIITDIGVGTQDDGVNELYKLIGISYWNETDGAQLESDIADAYNGPDGHKLPMSFVPLKKYKNKYRVAINPCHENDVVEIDTFAELQAVDGRYKV